MLSHSPTPGIYIFSKITMNLSPPRWYWEPKFEPLAHGLLWLTRCPTSLPSSHSLDWWLCLPWLYIPAVWWVRPCSLYGCASYSSALGETSLSSQRPLLVLSDFSTSQLTMGSSLPPRSLLVRQVRCFPPFWEPTSAMMGCSLWSVASHVLLSYWVFSLNRNGTSPSSKLRQYSDTGFF